MKKIPALLAVTAVLFAFLFPGCKKSSSTDDAATTVIVLTAAINNIAWTPDTLSANINYNAAAKTKTFSFTGTISQKRLTGAVTLTNAAGTNTFTIGTFPIDAAGNASLLYSLQQKDGNGNYVFVPYVAAASGDGYISIAAIDPVNNTITGTFNFTHKSTSYDSNGNIVSISNNVISSGAFTKMPYTFTSN